MSLLPIVKTFGGDLYAGGRRANIPAPGHSAADRSVSLLLSEGRVIIHSFGAATWQEAHTHLTAHGVIDADGRLAGAAGDRPVHRNAPTPGRLERRAAAEALWAAAFAPRTQSPAGRYCVARAADHALGRPWAVRSLAAAPVSVYRPSRFVRPALVCGVSSTDERLTAVELTYLTPGGGLCPRVRTPRKTIGMLPAGSAVRLAPAGPELLVGEGVFTALSAMAWFDLPGWALLSTSNLRRWTPPEGVRRVLIAADHGPDGEASARRLQAELVRSGVVARVALPPAPFGDWNDWAMAAGDGEGSGSREEGTGGARLGAG